MTTDGWRITKIFILILLPSYVSILQTKSSFLQNKRTFDKKKDNFATFNTRDHKQSVMVS